MPCDQIEGSAIQLSLDASQTKALGELLTWVDALQTGDTYKGFTLVSWSRDLPKEAVDELRTLIDPGETS